MNSIPSFLSTETIPVGGKLSSLVINDREIFSRQFGPSEKIDNCRSYIAIESLRLLSICKSKLAGRARRCKFTCKERHLRVLRRQDCITLFLDDLPYEVVSSRKNRAASSTPTFCFDALSSSSSHANGDITVDAHIIY